MVQFHSSACASGGTGQTRVAPNAFTLDCSQALLCFSLVHLHIPAPARPAENPPSWETPGRGYVPTLALSLFFQRCPAGQDRQHRGALGSWSCTAGWVAGTQLSELDYSDCLKTFLKFLKIIFSNFFSSQGWSAATAYPGSRGTMLSIWVQALGCATSAWPGETEPQVPSAKGLTEPLINNLFLPFLLSFFQCQYCPACWWRGAFYII